MKKYNLFRKKVQKIHIRLEFGKKKEYSAHIRYKFGYFNKKPNMNFYNNLFQILDFSFLNTLLFENLLYNNKKNTLENWKPKKLRI